MSKNLKKCIKELRDAMSYKDKPSQKAALKILSNKKCIYSALKEISTNIINKNIKLNKQQTNRLNKHSETIKGLKCGTKNNKRRKELIQQTGGFLPWLLPIVSTAISALL